MENITTKTNIYHCLNMIGAVSLIAFPSILIIAFSMHFMGEFGIRDFFNFKLSYAQPSPERFMELFRSNKSLDFVLPHLTVYLALPLLVPAIIYLSKILFNKKPILSVIGVLLTVVGAIYMGGIFGSWLSFVAIGNVSSEQVSESIPAVTELIQSNKLLSMTGILAGFSLIGFIVISIGLVISQTIPRWQAILILVGNVMIIMFIDLDNLMLIGATLWLIGVIPVGLKSFEKQQTSQ
jgi:hypothetical protein